MKEEKTIEELEKILEESEKKKEEYFSGWQRETADFINYKKKEYERLEGVLLGAKEIFFSEVIPVLDSFTLAEKAIKNKEDENVKGLLLIKKQLETTLKSLGLEEIDSIDKEFDPSLHEAVGEKEKEGVKPGIIIEEIEKGYQLKGRVIRPAKVILSK